MTVLSCEFESHFLHHFAEIAQLVEHNLAKVGVASSSLVFRSLLENHLFRWFFFFACTFCVHFFGTNYTDSSPCVSVVVLTDAMKRIFHGIEYIKSVILNYAKDLFTST